MTKEEYLLTCLSEECAEVAQCVSKALRFGLDTTYGDEKKTNREQLINELNDLVAVCGILMYEDVLPAEWSDSAAQTKKITKVMEYMDISEQLGRLDRPDSEITENNGVQTTSGVV